MTPLLDAATYTVTRIGAGAYVNGVYVDGATTTLEIRASIQPMSGDELQRAAVLTATHGIKLYAGREVILRTVDAVGAKADKVSYNGRVYQIQRGQPYGAGAPIPSVRYEAFASETGAPIP